MRNIIPEIRQWIYSSAPPSAPTRKPSYPPIRRKAQVAFTIHDQLGAGQIAEVVSVSIGGAWVGLLGVDQYNPNSAINVSVPQEGQYHYAIEVVAAFQGQPLPIYGSGEGVINIRHGQTFSLNGSFIQNQFGTKWLITLQ